MGDLDLFLDFEGRSLLDITNVGAQVWAEHPSTEILCCGWVLGMEAEVQIWLPGEPIPVEWLTAETWIAHNKDTERHLLRCKLGLTIPPERWVDTATVTSVAGMPRNLHDAGSALDLPLQKLSRAALQALCRPRKPSKKNPALWTTKEDRPDLWAQLLEYCKRDVDVMRGILKRVPPLHWLLPPRESLLGVITDEMNDEGVPIDVAGVKLAKALVEVHTTALRQEFSELVPGVNPRSPIKVAAALGLSNAKKDTVREALKNCDPLETPFEDQSRYQALTVLKTLKSSSVAKLDAALDRCSADDRLHGAMVFHGAGRTGRWSSMGFQLHNLIRGLDAGTVDWPAIDPTPGCMDRFYDALHAGTVELLYDNPTRAVASAMRGVIIGPHLQGDFAQIEARVLVTWAGQADAVAAYRQKKDLYKMLASVIYNVAVEQVNKDQRFMGKQGVLGAGYQVGAGGFQRMLRETYDINIPLDESKRIVYAYRSANPKVVSLWYATDRLVKQAVLENTQTLISHPDVPRIGVRCWKDWTIIRLPSGRCLWYYQMEIVEGNFGPTLQYWGRDIKRGGAWGVVETYGGKLVENVTQALARDVMADALIRLRAAGYKPRMTVHDDVVAASLDSGSDLERFEEIMSEPPKWWLDLPINVDAEYVRRYQ